MKTKARLFLITIIALMSCGNKNAPIIITAEDFHLAVDEVTEIIVHDIFSPPVASRVYVYPNIAAYEIIAQKNSNYESLAGKITDLDEVPKPDLSKNINYPLAALIAYMELSKQLIFSEEKVITFRDSLYTMWKNRNPTIFNNAQTYGLEVANHIGKWMDKDNYKQTRTMSRFTINIADQARWQPTPPAYMDGIEPHWNQIRPFVLDSAAQFKPIPPPKFSLEEKSDFYINLEEVYDTSLKIVEKGDTCEKVKIAKFWDCNPYVSVARGHLMLAKKKITPGAHWIGIVKIACRKKQFDFDGTVGAYTKVAISIADAFISCWDEKYRSNLVRPETLIHAHFDDEWEPILQTPPFPEYTSGHSVVSAAAATTLTTIFGDNFSFDDDTEIPYGLPIRSFPSINAAAEEAAISRMYGGIHYRVAIEAGLKQGREIGDLVNNKLKMLDIE